MTRTLTYLDGRKDAERERATISAPQLVLALDCANPRARPARFSLSNLDEVLLGRGPERSRVRVREGSGLRLRIHLPDGFMSSNHLRLFREDGRWHAEDAGSKNGTFLNDGQLDRARLEDGDILVAGKTVFLFLCEMEVFEDEVDVDLTGTSVADAPIATLNAPLARSLDRLMRIAPSPVPVLVRGATGTGKELVARAIHAKSGRTGPFVAVNCGALSPTLITSELFGVRKGAYSGAAEDRPGFVRSAHGGTLFLDEIAELPLEAQAAFLRVLQEDEVVPVGSSKAIKVDVKVVAATHRDLAGLVGRGEFREDLYARVAGHEVRLPPLHQRREDLGLVLATLLDRGGCTDAQLELDAARALFNYSWPRNIRELDHALQSALAVAGDRAIALDHLPEVLQAAERAPQVLLAPDERLVELLRAHGGNVSAVARDLATSRSQVRRIARRLGIDVSAYREG